MDCLWIAMVPQSRLDTSVFRATQNVVGGARHCIARHLGVVVCLAHSGRHRRGMADDPLFRLDSLCDLSEHRIRVFKPIEF